jgi:hypothetical protein
VRPEYLVAEIGILSPSILGEGEPEDGGVPLSGSGTGTLAIAEPRTPSSVPCPNAWPNSAEQAAKDLTDQTVIDGSPLVGIPPSDG